MNTKQNQLLRQKRTQQGRTTSEQLDLEQKYHKIMVKVYKVNEESEQNIEKMESVKNRLTQVHEDLKDTHFIADRFIDYKNASMTDMQYKKYLEEKKRSKSMQRLDDAEKTTTDSDKDNKKNLPPPRFVYYRGAKGSTVEWIKIDMDRVRENQRRYISSRNAQSRKIPKAWIY